MKYKVKAYVKIKDGVLDIQGSAVEKALKKMGYDNVENFRVGKYFEFDISGQDKEKAKEMTGKMGEELLANPLIEDFNFWLEAPTELLTKNGVPRGVSLGAQHRAEYPVQAGEQ